MGEINGKRRVTVRASVRVEWRPAPEFESVVLHCSPRDVLTDTPILEREWRGPGPVSAERLNAARILIAAEHVQSWEGVYADDGETPAPCDAERKAMFFRQNVDAAIAVTDAIGDQNRPKGSAAGSNGAGVPAASESTAAAISPETMPTA